MERDTDRSRVGTFEAKTHLSALLERVARGETITITRNGTPVARLAPLNDQDQLPRLSHQDVVKEMRNLRKQVKGSTCSIRDMIEEGRGY
ncbi:MAG: type II toxin-antitoxin system prevent-host-death family antitoxin [Acidobacteria bacterium]|nr:type II toxin-antitoxin system prevent-host-death family antitoxin [Acidobacteriota bacterium]